MLIILTHKVQLACIFKLYIFILDYSIVFRVCEYFSNSPKCLKPVFNRTLAIQRKCLYLLNVTSAKQQ